MAILNIVKVDDELVVQYTRNGEKFQCLLEHFKTYDSSSLIEYILK